MNLLRNSLLMRKAGDRRRTELAETFAFLCRFSAEFITRSRCSTLPLARDLRPAWGRAHGLYVTACFNYAPPTPRAMLREPILRPQPSVYSPIYMLLYAAYATVIGCRTTAL